jgi:hypothetical protein
MRRHRRRSREQGGQLDSGGPVPHHRPVAYADRAEQAQQEQLDWLHQIYEQEVAQTTLLREIAQHTRFIYILAILALVFFGIAVLASVIGSV